MTQGTAMSADICDPSLQSTKSRWLSGEFVEAGPFVQLCRAHGIALSDREADTWMRKDISIRSHGMNTIEMTGPHGLPNSKHCPGYAGYRLNQALHGIVPESELRLKVNPVPLLLHGQNMRGALPKHRWVALREGLLASRGASCEACGTSPSKSSDIEAHEEWEYSTARRPARAALTGIRLLCPKCHAIVHFGLQFALVKEGRLPEKHLQDLEDHFCAVNGVGPLMFELHLNDVFENWARLNKRKKWSLHFGPYQETCTREAKQLPATA